eukprot:TRINITY_DN763_c0_g1_i34.p1 TRINITY_DN763_c0_g1~~TRINITY_DN763_c0_g1_i34.p1  ORF type:complete len:110 (-),score=10.97 TRINITY_DN763_c0_g1_i34:188-517(-)
MDTTVWLDISSPPLPFTLSRSLQLSFSVNSASSTVDSLGTGPLLAVYLNQTNFDMYMNFGSFSGTCDGSSANLNQTVSFVPITSFDLPTTPISTTCYGNANWQIYPYNP